MNFPFFTTTKSLNEKYIERRWPELYKKLQFYPDTYTLSQKIYLFQHNLESSPDCAYCKKIKVKFIKFSQGYRKYCSKKCAALDTNQNDEVRKKRIQGRLSWLDDIEKKNDVYNKVKTTKSLQPLHIKKEIQRKRICTTRQRYGCDNISQVPDIKEKIRTTYKQNISKTRINRFNKREQEIKEKYKLINIHADLITCKCLKCDQTFTMTRSLFNQRFRFNMECCTYCQPVYSFRSNGEIEIFDFLKNECEQKVENNNKKLIYPYEIDIYLPDKNIGIEHNGTFYHSSKFLKVSYHQYKTELALQKNIRLIHIWQHEWQGNQHIIKQYLKKILNIDQHKIYARKCIVTNIDYKTYSSFLNENHLQGAAKSKFKYGLFYNNELVSVIGFSGLKRSLGYKSVKQLIRYCSKFNYSVIGGFEKLLHNFLKQVYVNTIIYYVDYDKFDGRLFSKLFTFQKLTKPEYFYVIDNKKYNRYNFRKSKLLKKEYSKEIMEKQKIYPIYNSGNLKFILNVKEY